MAEEDNIEHFFKSRLSSGEFDFQEADWQDLERKLDAEGLVPVPWGGLSGYKLLIVGLIIGVIAFLAGWFLRERLADEAGQAKNTSEIKSEVDASSVSEPGGGEGRQSDNKGQESIRQVIDPQPQDNRVIPANQGKSALSGDEDRVAVASDHPRGDALPVIGEQWLVGSDIEPFGHQYIVDSADLGGSTITPLVKAEEVSKEKTLTFRERWSLGASFAPDLNSIGFTARKSLTAKFGMRLFYQLGKRWEVSAGVFYNKKKYTTTAEGYSPPEGYWYYQTDNVKPTKILGSCGVVDVPVNVSYLIFEGKKMGLSGSVGLSSYFLQNEAYDFEFDRYYADVAPGWYTEENSSVLAGVANLSLIASLALSERSSLIAEPYVQAPFKKIGWGNVELFSTGVLFTYRYRLGFRKQ